MRGISALLWYAAVSSSGSTVTWRPASIVPRTCGSDGGAEGKGRAGGGGGGGAAPSGRGGSGGAAPPGQHRQAWMPHSVLPVPAQRPLRGSAPGSTRSVQVAQPIDG